MARPRRDDQGVVLDRIATALARRDSLHPWTLAEISPAAGLSPAGLIKRFGSRKGILRALSRRWIDEIPTGPVGLKPAAEELQEWARARFGGATPTALAQGLTQLTDDLLDDELRAMLAEGWAREQHYVATLLSACELRLLVDPERGATLLFDALNGAMLRQAADPGTDLIQATIKTLWETWT